jgi:hypothetical protein
MEDFLSWLHSDPEEAGRAYERLHRKLQFFFEGRREAARHAAELADASIDRAVKKLQENPTLRERDPISYVLAVARFILLEYRKKPWPERLETDPPAHPNAGTPEDDERFRCLVRCLARLSEDDHRTVLGYYAHDKGVKIASRRHSADDLGKSLNAFRVQVYRIRRQILTPCINRCLDARTAVTE